MILEIIIMMILVVLVAITVNKVEDYYKNKRQNKEEGFEKMSFKEAMDLTDLPIVTFKNEDVKLNFLLDTGSNVSQINAPLLVNLKYSMLDAQKDIIGIEGNAVQTNYCRMRISYKDKVFENDFVVHDLSRAFDSVKQSTGVQIHGILGSQFFQKYKYILNYDELVAYSKSI